MGAADSGTRPPRLKPAGGDLGQRIGAFSEAFQPSAARLARIGASIRDFIGCVVAGTRRPELKSALWLANGGGVPVWGLEDSFDPAGAALVAGTAGALLQLHDFYGPGASHPSSPVIPAAWSAFSCADVQRPEAFLKAVAAGYEAANRIADACMPGTLLAGGTPTAVAGTIGASVAAALLGGLDRGGVARAVSNAALLMPVAPSAAMRTHGALVPMHGGLAARAGYEAARLARDAGAGTHLLEGDGDGPGLLELLGGNAALLEPERWRGETIDAVGWKFFPACFASHLALEAVLRLEKFDPDSIERVIIRQPKRLLDSTVANGPVDGGLYDRLMSLRWVVARALELGRYEYPDAIEDLPGTTALAQRIEIVHDCGLDAALPDTLCTTIEVHSRQKSRSIEYRRPAAGAPPAGARGWSVQLDEWALRRKFETLAGAAPALHESLDALGIR